MFVPCRVFAVCLALQLHRRRRERSKGPSALYRLPAKHTEELAAAAEYSILGPGHHPFLSQFASATETLLVA